MMQSSVHLRSTVILFLAMLLLATLSSQSAWAQVVLGGRRAVNPSRPATTIQLPTFGFTTTNTTVLVPDRGQTSLGGIRRSSTGAQDFGVPLAPFRPFRNRAIGSSASASNMSVTAWIHDFEAMDRQLLDQAAAQRTGRRALATRGLAVGDQASLNATTDRRPATLNDLLKRPQAAKPDPADEAVAFLEKARQLVADGKPGVAKIYYQMALRRTKGSQRQTVLAELDTLQTTTVVNRN